MSPCSEEGAFQQGPHDGRGYKVARRHSEQNIRYEVAGREDASDLLVKQQVYYRLSAVDIQPVQWNRIHIH